VAPMVNSPATQVVQAKAPDARAFTEQATRYIEQAKFRKAEACIKNALRLQPDFSTAHLNQGIILYSRGKYESALESYEQALSLQPDLAEAHHNRSNALFALGSYDEAVTASQDALKLLPNNASIHNALGNAYKGLGKRAEAMKCYQLAIELAPAFPEAHNNLAVTLVELNKLDEAMAHYREALRLNPHFAEAYHNLGMIFMAGSSWEQAAVLYVNAIRLKPKYAEAYCHLGQTLEQQGKLKEAAICFKRAIRIKPDDPAAHYALALNRLIQGDFQRGWRHYEWRWSFQASALHPVHEFLWDGSSLEGKTILIHAEQGLGDTIQFIRYGAIVKQYGGAVIAQCQKSLLPLLKTCPGVDHLLADDCKKPAFDVQAPLLSLPRIVYTSLSTVPADVPYLFADPTGQEMWQRELSRYNGFKIGIAWQGNPRYLKDRERSIALIHFAPLARVPGVCLISLQKGAGAEQLKLVTNQFLVIDLGDRLDETSGAFMDTAGVMKNLDLVITCDTAIAHLAGALGVPVWVALASMPDWRWLLHREDTPWYPTMRLFRQTKPGDWDGVFIRMVEELSKKVATSWRTRSVTIEIAPGELIDKITILEIKSKRIRDAVKRRQVRAELAALRAVRDRDIGRPKDIALLTSVLKSVNERLWETEDEIRLCEQAKDFGPRFIELARSVCQHNDRRSALKRQINELLGSSLVEEKVYATCK
jgi:tetratricopeptide (TPR) repeat protein